MKKHISYSQITAQRAVIYFLLTGQLLTSCSFREELKLPNIAANEQQEQGGFTTP